MKEVAIIGMGNMGSAIHELLEPKFNVKGFGRGDDLTETASADVAIVAVKPADFAELADKLWIHINKQVVISIMAGISIRQVANRLGTEQVVRTMPNLALKVGEGLTAWFTKMTDDDLQTVQEILDAWGDNMRVTKEEQLHVFTATAGSGPAYFFEFAYLFEQAAMKQGFTPEQARKISVQTFRGAARLLDIDDSAEEWVKRVTSKGGTTKAGLNVFRERGQAKMIEDAVEAATQRSKELGQG